MESRDPFGLLDGRQKEGESSIKSRRSKVGYGGGITPSVELEFGFSSTHPPNMSLCELTIPARDGRHSRRGEGQPACLPGFGLELGRVAAWEEEKGKGARRRAQDGSRPARGSLLTASSRLETFGGWRWVADRQKMASLLHGGGRGQVLKNVCAQPGTFSICTWEE
jgi:hypothetical protein